MAAKLLILDAHSDAALACVQSLGRAGEYEIHLGGSRRDCPAFASRYVAQPYFYPDPQRDCTAFENWLRALDAVEHFDFILPVTDATILPANALREQLRGQVIRPPAEVLPWAFSKDRTVVLAEQVGVPVPVGRTVHRLKDAQPCRDFPLYLKPVASKVWLGEQGCSLNACMVQSRKELEEELERMLPYGPVLVQEYFAGYGVGIEVLCDQGQIVMAFAHRREHEFPLTGGRSTYRVSIPMPEPLLEASRRLLKAAGWHGVAMVEFKQRGDEFRLMEINGRFWGSLPLAIAAGADFPRALLELYRDGSRPVNTDYRSGLYARNLMSDLSWLVHNQLAPRNDPRLLTRPRLRSALEPLRVLVGREVWDHFARHDPGPGRWQLKRIAIDAARAILRRKSRPEKAVEPIRIEPPDENDAQAPQTPASPSATAAERQYKRSVG